VTVNATVLPAVVGFGLARVIETTLGTHFLVGDDGGGPGDVLIV